ncbi:MAG: aldehyde dehydrogenase (NADP(+)) [Lentisphaeraceae bacterium]|nr:aldehyde dehydrogenase (NADP(+)) [Lentisphaeraceae bacterium]
MSLHGKNFIGYSLSANGTDETIAVDPTTGQNLETAFIEATSEEINSACNLAAKAFDSFRNTSSKERAAFLRKIAENVVNLGDELIQRAVAETGLPEGRITGERGRTCGQLTMFADLIEEGSWVNARIDTAIPDRQPLPKPDIRYMERAIGPVAVFGASNFPLAFSTAGGDTASAIAAGCPVVLKAHPAHPGTAELVAHAAVSAAKECGMPEGTISMIHGKSHLTGQALVKHPAIKAVGFTGSIPGGRAIFDTAASRPEPIPVYAEMGSSNPVFLLPETIKKNEEALVAGLTGSICLGAGQFCTNPGMLVVQASPEVNSFIQKLAESIKNAPAGTMVHSSIKDGYSKELSAKLAVDGVTLLGKSDATTENDATAAQPAVFSASAETFLNNDELNKEVFGPCTFIVICNNKEQILEVVEHLEGHLTSSIHGEDEELIQFADVISAVEKKVGRLIINQYPTGVEVCSSMLHGGPYPASTDSRTTSVGTAAINRYARPVSYQNFPQALLPDEIKDGNPLEIWRLMNGKMGQE